MCILVVASFFGISYYFYADSYSSTYTYSIDIATNHPIEDVTCFLPLPSAENSTGIHLDIVDAFTTNKRGVYEISETEYGVMLKLTIDTVKPSDPFHVFVEIPAAHEINTKNPHDSEILLQPKMNMTQTECQFPHPHWDYLSCFTYKSTIFAQYNTPLSTEVSISVSLTGRNSWWVFGWSGNEYTDKLKISLEGESFHWKEGSGTLITGFGRYSPFF
jgi:hypothetical protein